MFIALVGCALPPWPYAVEPQPETAAGVAECLFRKAQERLSRDVVLGGVDVALWEDGRAFYEAYVPLTSEEESWCPQVIGGIEVRLSNEAAWRGRCSGEVIPSTPLPEDLYFCEGDLRHGYSGDPIDEWAVDSIDIAMPGSFAGGGKFRLRSASGVEEDWEVEGGYLDDVPPGRGVMVLEGADSALRLVDGVTGEVLFDGWAPRRD